MVSYVDRGGGGGGGGFCNYSAISAHLPNSLNPTFALHITISNLMLLFQFFHLFLQFFFEFPSFIRQHLLNLFFLEKMKIILVITMFFLGNGQGLSLRFHFSTAAEWSRIVIEH